VSLLVTTTRANSASSQTSAEIVAVVAEPEAVSFIAERGGRLYVYADASSLKHVKTEPPSDSAIRFKQIEADGFVLYVEDDIAEPEVWNVKFHHLPWPHVDVLWDGHQPGLSGNSPAIPSPGL
jgi:hypothetical protein